MAKMKKLLFVIMMCVAVVANAQSWSKNLEKKAPKTEPKKSKYNYSELERRAFLKIANGGE